MKFNNDWNGQQRANYNRLLKHHDPAEHKREAIHRHAHIRQLHGGLIIVLGVPHREVAVLCFCVREVLDPCHGSA